MDIKNEEKDLFSAISMAHEKYLLWQQELQSIYDERKKTIEEAKRKVKNTYQLRINLSQII